MYYKINLVSLLLSEILGVAKDSKSCYVSSTVALVLVHQLSSCLQKYKKKLYHRVSILRLPDAFLNNNHIFVK